MVGKRRARARAPVRRTSCGSQQPGQGMVSAGLMPDAAEPTVLTGDAATATAAAVSVEPDTGSAKPTTDPIALFPLQPTGGNGST